MNYKEKIFNYIAKVEEGKGVEGLDLSVSGLTPYALSKILEEKGYERYDSSVDGWEMDFEITYIKEGLPNALLIRGAGIYFSLILTWGNEW